jgi:CIC family chloride channel protein
LVSLRKWKGFPHVSETTGQVLLAIAVGAGAGLGAVAFRWLIAAAKDLSFGGAHELLSGLGRYYVILVPAAGGIVVGLLIYFLAREAKGHGVPEVMLAVSLESGRIRPRVAVVKALASAVCIGSGGSAGREGPIVQIGSTIGSTIGQVLRLPSEKMRLLVACGAAGGIAATFNAPIAGVIFGLEVILREFAIRSFGTVVLSSVTAVAVSRGFLGSQPAFRAPSYSLVSAWELPLYFALGILAAGAALLFVKALYACEDVFDAWRIPEYVKPVVGGLLIGTIGVWFPQVFGVGYETIQLGLEAKLVIGMAGMLVLAKVVATSLTIGSGGSGGVFAPSLFIGSMLGAAFGHLVHGWLPGVTAGSGAYSLVGMGAVFAGAAHAPMTSVLILFEMTGDYRIILPLMTSVVVSTLVTERVSRDSIYTLKLRRRGIEITAPRHYDLMDSVLVGEAMSHDFETVPADMPVPELVNKFTETGHHGFPVVDREGKLVGIVTLSDVDQVDVDTDRDVTVGSIATTSLVTCFRDNTLRRALREFGARDVGRVPVVDRRDPTRLVGMLRRHDIIRAYGKAIDERSALEERARNIRFSAPGIQAVVFMLRAGSPWAGKRVAELHLPSGSLLVAVERAGQSVLPRGSTALEAGDRLTVLATPDAGRQIRALSSAGE